MKQNILNKLHETQLEILNQIVTICENNQLEYFLIGGTLLGAVRHQGFIPWDDDLDIAMPRKDFKKFIKIAQKQLKKDFFLQTALTDNYSRLFVKVRKNGTLFLENDDKHISRHHGVFVDIFPLYSGKKRITKRLGIKRIAYAIDQYIRNKVDKLPYKQGAKKLLNLIPYKMVVSLRDFLFNGKGKYYINYGSQYGVKKQTIEKEKYLPASKLEFEGRLYNVPNDYQYVLRKIYGPDYMQLPPEEKRVTHNPVRISFDTNGPDEVLED